MLSAMDEMQGPVGGSGGDCRAGFRVVHPAGRVQRAVLRWRSYCIVDPPCSGGLLLAGFGPFVQPSPALTGLRGARIRRYAGNL
jgi:hypothetical protein